MVKDTYYQRVAKQFAKKPLGVFALAVIAFYVFVGIYAPLFASSKPIIVYFQGEWYFPLFRYLFFKGFYTKGIDLFFNLLMFTIPLALFCGWLLKEKKRKIAYSAVFFLQLLLFLWLLFSPARDPAVDREFVEARKKALLSGVQPTWAFDLQFMPPYAKLNLALRYQQRLQQHQRLVQQTGLPEAEIASLWQLDRANDREAQQRWLETLTLHPDHPQAKTQLSYIEDRQKWLEETQKEMNYAWMPLLRHFHWEEDAGGSQLLNQKVDFWDLTRINRKDLVAALLFGVRVSLVVGLLSVGLSLLIGLPIGAFAGYYGGKWDILVSRLLEIWESMPVLFMLLLVVAMIQSKSIFLVIAVIGFFGWTTITRYVRGEFFKQRNLPYIESAHAMGFPNRTIMFSHILPNAIPPVLTLIPFAIMTAIMSEAGLSFLGLGEEGSSSWGVLMDEGRQAFPSESYLLWPPAILLTILLISIALVGDALRDAIDPKA